MICPICDKPIYRLRAGRWVTFVMVNGKKVWMHTSCRNDAARELIKQLTERSVSSAT